MNLNPQQQKLQHQLSKLLKLSLLFFGFIFLLITGSKEGTIREVRDSVKNQITFGTVDS
jgi:hypothetical protein